jgi:hypothetical protein
MSPFVFLKPKVCECRNSVKRKKCDYENFFSCHRCAYRIDVVAMNENASTIIDFLGGTTAVAKLMHAPISTVHSWRRIGIPKSRLAHLELVAKTQGKSLPVQAG